MKKVLGLVFVGLLVVASAVMAQQEAAPEMDYGWGVVDQVNGDVVVIAEYDYETDQETSATYRLDPNVALEGIATLAELKAEDTVEFYYVSRDGEKVIMTLALDTAEEEELLEEVSDGEAEEIQDLPLLEEEAPAVEEVVDSEE